MIQLTRLNNQPLAVNSDLIKFVENAHDTVLTLVNGEKIVVRETVEQVIERVVAFRRAVPSGLASVGANLGFANQGLAASPSESTENRAGDLRAKADNHGHSNG